MAKATVNNLKESSGLYTGPAEITGAYFGRAKFGKKARPGKPPTALIATISHPGPGDALMEEDLLLTVNGFNKTGPWVPSDDGDDEATEGNFLANSEGEEGTINKSAAFGAFLGSLVDLGFEMDEIDASKFVGLKITLARVKNTFMDKKTGKEQSFERVVVTEILDETPWEAEGGSKKAAGKKAAKPVAEDDDADDDAADDDDAPTASTNGAVDRKTLLAVMEAVMDANKKGVLLKNLTSSIYTILPKQFKALMPKRKAVADGCSDEEFLGSKQKVFEWDEDTGKITPA